MKTVTKSDIVDSVNAKMGFSKKDSIEIVDRVFESIKLALERGEAVKIAGFGKFEVRQKHKRRGRNPQTGEEIEISARKVLTFRPSQILRDAMIQVRE